jgi:hypothetical protein
MIQTVCIDVYRDTQRWGVHKRIIEKFTYSPNSSACLRQYRREQMPHVRHSRPDFEFDVPLGGPKFVRHPNRVVA